MNTPKDLPARGNLARKLTKYSVATVGGVTGMTAGFECSEAALAVTDVSITLFDSPSGPPTDFQVDLDLNGDATDDARVVIFSASMLSAQGLNGASLAGALGGGGFFYPSALTTSNRLGPAAFFSGGTQAPTNTFGTLANSAGTLGPMVGNWLGGVTAYMGVEFDISGNTHYGWVHITWDPSSDTATIDRYAYERRSGEAAHVPEPSALALLGLGALGLAARRRRAAKG